MNAYKNILVINLMHLGDLLLTTPVFHVLRRNFPDAKITLLADKKLRNIVEHNPHLDDFLFLDKKGADDKLWPFFKFIMKVRRHRFDLVINLHRNERASALAAFSGGERIIGYSKPGFNKFFTETMPNRHFKKHQVEAHFDVLRKYLGITDFTQNGLEMVIPPAAKESAEEIWKKEIPAGAKVVALNIGASWLTKRWIKEYFAVCADQLIAEGYHVAFLGGTMDEEIVHGCIASMREKESAALHIFTGRLSLGELAGVLSHMVLFMTTDSGPMHVGVAMRVPIVTMFGASPVTGFCPYDARDILIKTPEPCHPCRIHECQLEGERHLACMKNIPVETVMHYAHALLEETGGREARELGDPAGYVCRVVDLARPEGAQLCSPDDFSMDTDDTNPVKRVK